MNITLIIVLLIIILMGVWGWFSGFIKMVCLLCSSVIIFILTLFISPVITNVMTDSESIYGFFHEKVAGNIDLPSIDASTALKNFDSIDIPDGIEGSLREGLEGLAGNINTASGDASVYIRDKVTLVIIKVVAFAVTYVIVSILVGIIFKIFNVLAKLPVINFANRALGITAGIALGLLLVFVFMTVISFMTPGTITDIMRENIKTNGLLGWIYDHNFILPIVRHYLG